MLGTEPVNVAVTQQFVLMPAVDVVPTTNKLITDAVLFDKLTFPQTVEYVPEILQLHCSLQCYKGLLFLPTLNRI